MIQNLGNKMKVQTNRMETRIKKIQKMFNKDLGKRENRQSAMNNTITDKNTLERSNSRITETEEWVTELQDRTVEITETEKNK